MSSSEEPSLSEIVAAAVGVWSGALLMRWSVSLILVRTTLVTRTVYMYVCVVEIQININERRRRRRRRTADEEEEEINVYQLQCQRSISIESSVQGSFLSSFLIGRAFHDRRCPPFHFNLYHCTKIYFSYFF